MVHYTKHPNLHYYSFTHLPHILPYIIPNSSIPSDLPIYSTYVPPKYQANRSPVPKSFVYSRSDSKQGSSRSPNFSATSEILHLRTPSNLRIHHWISSFSDLACLLHSKLPVFLKAKTIRIYTNYDNRITYFILQNSHHTHYLPSTLEMTKVINSYFSFESFFFPLHNTREFSFSTMPRKDRVFPLLIYKLPNTYIVTKTPRYLSQLSNVHITTTKTPPSSHHAQLT